MSSLPLSYNIRNLIVRWKVTLLAIGGIALVVAVMLVLVAMSNGFRIALRSTGSPENAMVVQRGAQSELNDACSRESANLIMVDRRIAHDAQGRVLASPEIMVVNNMQRRQDGESVNVVVRGVTLMAFEVRNTVRIVEGRAFTPGLYELVVGTKARKRYVGLDVGQPIRLQRRSWTVVGVFEADGSGFESEIWGDLDVMAPAFNRNNAFTSITVRLVDHSPAAIKAFDDDLRRNPAMQVELRPEREFYEDQAGGVSRALMGLAGFVAVVMGIGAVFGAMNTMYGIVAARTREIGTLRALGFSRASILVAFVLESTFLAVAGGVVGCLAALPANGITSSAGGANFAEVAFAFRITSAALGVGILFAVMMGILGGLLPALKAARLPITSALRAG
jgi:putative ABC transport system permease protein